MNREKILFLVVLGIVALWSFSALTGEFEAGARPDPRWETEDAPPVAAIEGKTEPRRFLALVAPRDELASIHEGKGRTFAIPHTDLLPVAAAVLDLPRSLPTPWVLPPVAPFPDVPFYRWFRMDEIPVFAAGGDDTGLAPPPAEEEEELAGPDEEDVLGARKWEFVESEWDVLKLPAGIRWYGTISLKDAEKKQGFTKFDLLLPGNENLPFYWVQIDTKTGKTPTDGTLTLAGSRIEGVEFADTIGNRYGARRTLDRVKKGDVTALTGLGAWVMELAEEERYDRMAGLELAIRTFLEAFEAAPGNQDAILGLGEAYHRAFRFDEELALYQNALAERPRPSLYKRLARLYETISLPGLAEKALSDCLATAVGDTAAQLRRAQVRYELGRIAEAERDFVEVAKLGNPEEKSEALEGRARCLLSRGSAAEAAALLSSATDPDSLATRGAALYAQKKWDEAADCFRRALEAEPDHVTALTNLGYAQAWTAEDASGIQEAVETLKRARDADALNYFRPPLGEGFAEQRRGQRVASVDRYKVAALALPTDPYVHYVLGRSYLRDGLYSEARQAFRDALRLDYRFVDALFGAGTAALAAGDVAAAREQLTRAVTLESRVLAEGRLDPSRERAARVSLARSRYRLAFSWLLADDVPDNQRWTRAEEPLQAIYAADDTFVPAINALGYLTYQKGDARGALEYFYKAKTLAPDTEEGRIDLAYAEECIRRILDFLGRRLWVEDFDRDDGPEVGNAWVQSRVGNVGPRLDGGKVVISGAPSDTGGIWLVHGDPVPGPNRLGRRFIRCRTTVTLGKRDRVEFRYLVFTKDNTGNPQHMIGVARNALNQIVFLSQKGSDRDRVEQVLEDEDNRKIEWPEGEVDLEIRRIDAKDGVFGAFVNGERIGTADLGIKRNTNSPLFVGFLVPIRTPNESFTATVDDVEMEIYYDR